MNDMDNDLKNRKPNRYKGFDYSASGAYFLTICTHNRQKNLSTIVGGDVLDAPKVQLLPCGRIAEKYLNQLSDFYDNVTVERYVIMPNHIHFILLVSNDGASRTSPPTRQHATVSSFVSTFKRFCDKEIGQNVWQRNFHDHVIRSLDEHNEYVRYIFENPRRWELDELYSE